MAKVVRTEGRPPRTVRPIRRAPAGGKPPSAPAPPKAPEAAPRPKAPKTAAVRPPRAAGPAPPAAAGEPPKIVRARSPFAWLRPVLLLLGFLMIAAVAVMLAAYRFGRAAEEAAQEAVREGGITAKIETVLSGEGFDFKQTSEGVPVFRIRAEKSEQERDGTAFLDTVTLDVYGEDGVTYTVTSENAVFNEESWTAKLQGSVVLRGWDRLELEARALELHEGGQVLKSVGEVEFRYPPDLMGRAGMLHVDRRNDTITLAGGVHIHSSPGAEKPMRLDCDRLVYQRSGFVVRAMGDVALTSDLSSIRAHYLTLFLQEDQRTVDMVRARWGVTGKVANTNEWGGVTEIDYHAEFLELHPDNPRQQNQRAKLDGEGETVSLIVTDPTGLRRTFTGLYLFADAKKNRLVQLEGVGEPVVVKEALDLEEPYPLRQLCAGRITARFGDSGLARIQLERGVELNDRALSLTGGRTASLNVDDGMFRIHGKGDEVELYNDRAEVRAEQYTFARRTGVIRAYGGVRAALAERSVKTLSQSPLGSGQGPVQVESEEAFWTTEPATFTFDGDVRAWRGENLLLADQLIGDEEKQELAASGRVRTVWASSDAAGIPIPGADAGTRAPIEVSADSLAYLRDQDLLVYKGGVEMRQAQRTLHCRELAVELAAAGQAERMICAEGVRLRDEGSGRRAQGDRAVYTLAEKKVEIFGEEVQLIDAENNRMQGRYLVYDLAADKFNLLSRPPEESAAAGPPFGAPGPDSR